MGYSDSYTLSWPYTTTYTPDYYYTPKPYNWHGVFGVTTPKETKPVTSSSSHPIGTKVEVPTIQGTIVSSKEAEDYHAMGAGCWTGVKDEASGVVHLFYKYNNPAKPVIESWPPRENDVWEIRGRIYHTLGSGKIYFVGGGTTGRDPKSVLGESSDAKLLFRKS